MMQTKNDVTQRFVCQSFFVLLLGLLMLASLVGCVQETKSRKVDLTPAPQAQQTPKATQEASPGPVPGLVAAMLDSSLSLPSAHSEKGLETLVNALRDCGITALAVSGWDELSRKQDSGVGAQADIIIIVSFHDIPNMRTFHNEEQECGCKFAGRVVHIATGRVLHEKEISHKGAPGPGFESSCLDAVNGAAELYAKDAAEAIRNYMAGRVGATSD
ncbi:MAG: hypothetical protein JW759_01630 [Candidatus Coatesbacteria bacterium]|nr:hypothetical protein [Candidatus Coatesbacteria bacterium]